MSTMHAVLIGIDNYAHARPLSGCVNDIDEVHRILREQLGIGTDHVVRLTAPREGNERPVMGPSAPPTRERMVEVLRELGTDRVSADDSVFFYYSGHGASVPIRSSSAIGNGSPLVVLREALVPMDVYFDDEHDAPQNLLFDFELNELLRRIAARTKRLTAIFDCCNSQGVTKGAVRHPDDAERCFHVRGVVRAEDVGVAAEISPEAAARDGSEMLFEFARAFEGCAVAAACLADESAMEGIQPDGRRGGYFTSALVRQWDSIPKGEFPNLRWGRIWRQVLADVEQHEQQHPRLMASYGRKVFGGPPEDGDTGFTVRPRDDGYLLDVGELAGVTEGARVAVYGSDPPLLPMPVDSQAERNARLGTLEVRRTGPDFAVAVPAEDCAADFKAPPSARGRIIEPGGASRLTVAVRPADGMVLSRLEALRSPFLRFAGPDEMATATLQRCADGSWAITDDMHGTGDTPGEATLVRVSRDADPSVLVGLLEHYRSYIEPVHMAARCLDLPAGMLQLGLLDCNAACDAEGRTAPGINQQDPDITVVPPLVPSLPQRIYDLRVDADMFCYEVRNHYTKTLYVTLIECGSSGRVSILGGGQAAVEPNGRHVFWYGGDLGLASVVGLAERQAVGIDRVVAIGTTAHDKTLEFLRTNLTFEQVSSGIRLKEGARRAFREQWTADRVTIRARRAA